MRRSCRVPRSRDQLPRRLPAPAPACCTIKVLILALTAATPAAAARPAPLLLLAPLLCLLLGLQQQRHNNKGPMLNCGAPHICQWTPISAHAGRLVLSSHARCMACRQVVGRMCLGRALPTFLASFFSLLAAFFSCFLRSRFSSAICCAVMAAPAAPCCCRCAAAAAAACCAATAGPPAPPPLPPLPPPTPASVS